jgi:hypothetical protein
VLDAHDVVICLFLKYRLVQKSTSFFFLDTLSICFVVQLLCLRYCIRWKDGGGLCDSVWKGKRKVLRMPTIVFKKKKMLKVAFFSTDWEVSRGVKDDRVINIVFSPLFFPFLEKGVEMG